MELTNQEMFEYYGISEWEEKREILANEELALLIRELKKNLIIQQNRHKSRRLLIS